MATLNFIKGSIKGRVGQFVGSSWRGKDYIKTYTPPSNPRTEGQIAVRTIFQHVAAIAKAIYGDVLKPYTFPTPHKLTAYNRMIQINKELFDDLAWDQTKLKIFDGPLYNPGIASAVLTSGGSSKATVTWNPATGEGTDIAFVILHDETTEQTLTGKGTRQTGTLDVDAAPLNQADLTKVHAYLVFSQPPGHGSGETGHVSPTAYSPVSPPAP
jgi:hypothetical protein